jgi:predicted nucleic acid-binding protein
VKLIDTTVAVDHLRGTAPAVALMTGLADEGEPIAASELVRFELLAGVRPSEIDALDQFFTSLIWLAVDEDITRTAGSLTRKHRKSHSGIDDVDYLIAATAIVCDADLFTTNVRRFPMIEGLSAPY